MKIKLLLISASEWKVTLFQNEIIMNLFRGYSATFYNVSL